MNTYARCLVGCSLLWTGCVGSTELSQPQGNQKYNESVVCDKGLDCCLSTEQVCSGDPDKQMICGCFKAWDCNDYSHPTKCQQKPADKPDGQEGWSCSISKGQETCKRSGGNATDKNGWVCTAGANTVECTRTTNTPDGGGNWTCEFSGETKTCNKTPNTTTDAGVPHTDGNNIVPPGSDAGTTPKLDQGANPPDYPGWDCYKETNGVIVCKKPGGGLPPGGDWKCIWHNGTITCEGSSPVPPGEGWTCVPNVDVGGWRCDTPQGGNTPPGGGQWSCSSGSSFGGTICTQQPPLTGGGECVPGTKKWCDGMQYCGYGQVTCGTDGKWERTLFGLGPENCLELANGQRPATMCACYFGFFNKECCETPDCIVPPNTSGQICPASAGQLCDYCNPMKPECQGINNVCMILPTYETFCTQPCSNNNSCPSGYQCIPSDLGGQTVFGCVPNDQSCYH
jgi:hypothetical protein